MLQAVPQHRKTAKKQARTRRSDARRPALLDDDAGTFTMPTQIRGCEYKLQGLEGREIVDGAAQLNLSEVFRVDVAPVDRRQPGFTLEPRQERRERRAVELERRGHLAYPLEARVIGRELSALRLLLIFAQ